MRAADRLRNDPVDDAERLQIFRSDLHIGRGFLGAGRIAPENGGGTFRRDHRIDRMFEHVDAVAGGDRDCAARAAFADDDGDDRHLHVEAHFRRTGDGFGLAALFRANTGIGASRIDEGDDRQRETVGQFQHADRLAVTFRARAAKIMLQAALGVVAFFLADDGDGLAVESGKARLDGGVFGKFAVTGERREIGEQRFGIIDKMRTLRMARDLRFLPGVQLGIDVLHRVVDARFQTVDLLRGVYALVFIGKLLQLDDLALKVRDRFFEVEIIVHEIRFRSFCARFDRIIRRFRSL
ncbi:hypothetical protein D3C71_596330 [compost metagenome]